ncbi:discoidin domain-containing protein [Nocardia amikacinitolerans]|uniref:discoidin domain-containing protein n=1 Tax=Nocardia amikacinitolerans TaxID=756689 RepID=UPI0020A5794F|nr:discoidin domain-containing protein [Nocardia amikacinitolerans]MCP2287247.1 Trehalose and maltose hydrolase (possible phosphorylase) [Nocardia amikacinitolerans]
MSFSARPFRRILLVIVLGAVLALVTGVALVVVREEGERSDSACPGVAETAGWAPSNTDVDAPIDGHPFVGNGYLGLRVPPRGTGYLGTDEPTGWPLYTPAYDGAFVAGLYGRSPDVADDREVAAAIPNWSGLLVGVGDETYSPTTPAARITDFEQTLHLRCGLVRTRATWTTADGRTTDLVYDVFAARSDQHVGAVRLSLRPRWSGELVLTDLLDGAGARRLVPTGAGQRGEAAVGVGFRTAGTEVAGSVVSVLDAGPGATISPSPSRDDLTASQQARISVREGESYTATKFVGIDTARTAADPAASALTTARRAASAGWGALLTDTTEVWTGLWRGEVEIPGEPDVRSWTRGALYSLYSASNPSQDNSLSPVGLSSDNYAGAVFWDADIWMFPALLHFAPDLAKTVVEYRYRTLPAAKANARRLGFPGAFYPWTSATDGDLDECHSWDPPHCLNQIHLQGDVSLAALQYYLATGDAAYLRDRVWPIMSALAEFWAARVTPNPDGSFSLRDVAGPDEYSNGVDDGVYTNAVAALALRNAVRAAEILGAPHPPEWTAVADGLRMPFDAANGVFAQFDGYTGTPIKQADTVLLIYPLEWPMPTDVATRVLEYYSARTDPDGPAMTDSVHAIDAAHLGAPGCATNTFLDRAARPFVRPPFAQFAEARGAKAGARDPLAGAPAFTFATAAGGFLQSLTSGLLGLRLRGDAVEVNPTLPPQFERGMTIRGMHWQGRTFDADIGTERTTVTLTGGAPMPLRTPSGTHTIAPGAPVTIETRRPDLAPTANLARCRPVTSSSTEPGRYPDAAVDGSIATGWAPDGAHGSLTVDLGAAARVERVLPRWGEPGPVASSVAVSENGREWATVAADPASGALTEPVSARYVRLEVTGADPALSPAVRELEVSGSRD